ncbi:MAG: hypothetical protein LBO80_10785 [Treponema sp.]|jgi:hypothetical protein|nr:hypothetical protein [Treponema sp.]
MALKHRLPVLFFTALAVFPASAATVSFLVVETGIAEGAAAESSGIWESGLMDAFFDAGHIVSSAPVLRLSGAPDKPLPGEAEGSFNEALEGGADFFVLALLEFQDSPDNPKPRRISLRLFSTRPRRFIYEEQLNGGPETVPGEEFAAARNAARAIVSRLQER